jgi:YidC/Oxa1 family membrane protein insertase
MDIRRTILLMIFSFSLLMLWNNWQVHQGNPPLFGAPTAVTKPKVEGLDPAAQAANAGVPTAPVTTSGATVATVPGLATATTAAVQTVSFKTDVLALVFDLQGAQLIRTDLLVFPSVDDPAKPLPC